MRKAIVALSGGVDSSIAASVLLDHGFEVLGVTLRLGEEGIRAHAGEDIRHTEVYVEESAAVARHLGIKHLVIDARSDFQRHVINPSIEAYQHGFTPNPCVYCNDSMKFGLLAGIAVDHDAILATGHYARIAKSSHGEPMLCRAIDASKDQSYMLFHLLEDDRLENVIFPLGTMTKSEVRSMADNLNLPSAAREESQDICFPLKSLIPAVSGRIIDENGKTLGYHEGVHRFTIGQRQGLGIAAKNRLYVTAIHPETNEIVVGPNDALFTRSAVVHPFSWSRAHAQVSCRVMAKIRYNHTPSPAILELDGASLTITFEESQRAITPGQVCACFIDDCLLAGGIIQSTKDSP